MLITPIKDLIENNGYDAPTKTLTEGKAYFVYAVERSGSKISYYILNDKHAGYPTPYSSLNFNVLSGNKPSAWVTYNKGIFRKYSFSSFPEWTNDLGEGSKPGFYQRLIDSEPTSSENIALSQFIKIGDQELKSWTLKPKGRTS